MNTEIACDQVASPAVDRCRDRRNICRPVAKQSERKPNLSSTSFHMKLQSSVSNQPINAAYVHGILLGYEVRLAKDDGSTLTWISKRLGPEIHHILLDELAPNTWFLVVICARTSKGCGKEYFDLVQTWEDGEFSFWRQ